MNKLCCLLNTSIHCQGCGGRWCNECSRAPELWYAKGTDHPKKYRFDGYNKDGWLCPVAGLVGLVYPYDGTSTTLGITNE